MGSVDTRNRATSRTHSSAEVCKRPLSDQLPRAVQAHFRLTGLRQYPRPPLRSSASGRRAMRALATRLRTPISPTTMRSFAASPVTRTALETAASTALGQLARPDPDQCIPAHNLTRSTQDTLEVRLEGVGVIMAPLRTDLDGLRKGLAIRLDRGHSDIEDTRSSTHVRHHQHGDLLAGTQHFDRQVNSVYV